MIFAQAGRTVSQQVDSPLPWYERFTLGGYGEFHGNFGEGSGGDKADLHRVVLYVGYEFDDWISFNSEIELEHAYVSEGSDGELSFEQAYFDFLILYRRARLVESCSRLWSRQRKTYVVCKVLHRRLSDKSRKSSGEVGLLGLQLSLQIPPSRPPFREKGGCAR